MNKFRKTLDNKILILDSSFLSPANLDIPHTLYGGLQNLNELDLDILEEGMNRLRQTRQLILEKEVIIIPEVYAEIKEGFRIMNHQASFMKNYSKRRKIKQEQKYLRKVYSKNTNEDNEDLFLVNREILATLQSYTNKFYQLLKLLKEKSSNPIASDEIAIYESYLSLLISQNYINSNPKKFEEYPINIGEALDTDNKIIATGFTLTLSRNQNSYILTHDRGIQKQIGFVDEAAINSAVQKEHSIPYHKRFRCKTLAFKILTEYLDNS